MNPLQKLFGALGNRGASLGRGAPENGYAEYKPQINSERVATAYATMQRYMRGKKNLDAKIVANEEWYKLRHWEQMRKGNEARGERTPEEHAEPASAWLFNALQNKHADAMDNFPSPNILPREEGDKAEAELLSSVVPVLLDQCDFEKTYSDVWQYKLKHGAGVYGVFWDGSAHGGLGDVSIRKVDLLRMFWEPGVTDIQESANLFVVDFVDRDLLESQYPNHEGSLASGESGDVTKYIYDDEVDLSDKCMVVDWYYKRRNQAGKVVLHYCKFSGSAVLYATENEVQRPVGQQVDPTTGQAVMVEMGPSVAERGLYDHGRYPFEFDVLFPIEGSPAGYSYIDIGKEAQEYIDRSNSAILENLFVNAKPRAIVKNSSGLNEEEFADTTRSIVHAESLSGDSVIFVRGNTLPSVYLSVLEGKIAELKEVTGCRDVATGGSPSGVTAASAIAALQEAGSKQSRDIIKTSYRTYRHIVLLVIELIRQFYDLPRCFRIAGDGGAERYVKYSNANIRSQTNGDPRVPLFDIEVTAQKQSPYSKMSQNELALQFYGHGFFQPGNADNALACLEMMDFDRKSFVQARIAQNGTMYQQMLQMQQQIAMLTEALAKATGMPLSQSSEGRGSSEKVRSPSESSGKEAPDTEGQEMLGGDSAVSGESEVTRSARERAMQSTAPR